MKLLLTKHGLNCRIYLSYSRKFKVVYLIYVGRALMEEVLRKEAIRRHLFGESQIDVYSEEHELRPSSIPSHRLLIHCKVGRMTRVCNLEVST